MKLILFVFLTFSLTTVAQFGRKAVPALRLKVIENLGSPNTNTVIVTYGPNDRILELTEYIRSSAGEWIEWNKISYNYNSFGNVEKINVTGVAEEKMGLSKQKKMFGNVTSNSVQRRELELSYLAGGSILRWAVKPEEYSFSYDNNGRVISQQYAHNPTVRDVYDYNNANNIAHRIQHKRETSQTYTVAYSDSMLYSSSGDLIQYTRFIPFYGSMLKRYDRIFEFDKFNSFSKPFLFQGQAGVFNPFQIIIPAKTNNYREKTLEYEYAQNGFPFMLYAQVNGKQGVKYRFHYVKGEDYSWNDFLANRLPPAARILDSLNLVEENRLRPLKIYALTNQDRDYFASLQAAQTYPSYIQAFKSPASCFTIANFSRIPFLIKVSNYKSFLLPPGQAALLKDSLLSDTSRLEVKYPTELYEAQLSEFKKNYLLYGNYLDKSLDLIAQGILKRDHSIVTELVWKDAKGNVTNVEYPDPIDQELRNMVIDVLVPLFVEAAKEENKANAKKLVVNMEQTERLVAASNSQTNYESYHFKFPSFASDAKKPRPLK